MRGMDSSSTATGEGSPLQHEVNEYGDALEALKRICGGPSENVAIANVIQSHWPRKTLRMLDVGTGDGTSAAKIAAALCQQGIVPSVLGIDKLTQHAAPKITPPGHYQFSQIDFFDFASLEKFDVVLFRQSIYYLGDVDASLAHASSLLASGGFVIVVCWQTDCTLRKILAHADPENPALDVGPLQLQRAAARQNLDVLSLHSFVAPIDLSQARLDVQSLLLPLRVLLRGRSAPESTSDRLSIFLRLHCGNIENRSNAILVLAGNALK